MSGNDSGDSTHAHSGDVDCLVVDGVEYLAEPYSGCPNCSTTNERLPFFEVSMKECLEGIKRKYPIRSDISLNSSADVSFSSIADQVKHLTGQLRCLKDNNHPTQISDKINLTKPSIYELERVVNTSEFFLASIKSKLMKYSDRKSHQFRGGTLEPQDEVREEEPGPENAETVMCGDEIESCDDETTVVRNESSGDETAVGNETTVVRNESRGDETTLVRDESSDETCVRSEMKNKSSVKVKTKNDYKSAKVRRNKAVSPDQETESSDSEIEMICDESESGDAELSRSGEALSKVNRNNEHRQTSRREQSSGKGVSCVYDNDNSCAELEIHSGVHGSSSVKGRISIRKHHINDDKFKDYRSKDVEEQQPPEKKSRGPEEESPAWHSSLEFSESYPTTGSQRSVESETTESSLYETAKEMSSQDSEVLQDSSGSATP